MNIRFKKRTIDSAIHESAASIHAVCVPLTHSAASVLAASVGKTAHETSIYSKRFENERNQCQKKRNEGKLA